MLANTAARIGSVELWTERIAFVKQQGMATLADVTMPRWFTEAFRTREPQTIEQFRSMIAACSTGRLSELLRGAARRGSARGDQRDSLPGAGIAGSADPATPPEALQFIHERIAGSRLVTLDAAHLTNVEQHERSRGLL